MVDPRYQELDFDALLREEYAAYCKRTRAPVTFEAWSLQEECKHEASGLFLV